RLHTQFILAALAPWPGLLKLGDLTGHKQRRVLETVVEGGGEGLRLPTYPRVRSATRSESTLLYDIELQDIQSQPSKMLTAIANPSSWIRSRSNKLQQQQGKQQEKKDNKENEEHQEKQKPSEDEYRDDLPSKDSCQAEEMAVVNANSDGDIEAELEPLSSAGSQGANNNAGGCFPCMAFTPSNDERTALKTEVARLESAILAADKRHEAMAEDRDQVDNKYRTLKVTSKIQVDALTAHIAELEETSESHVATIEASKKVIANMREQAEGLNVQMEKLKMQESNTCYLLAQNSALKQEILQLKSNNDDEKKKLREASDANHHQIVKAKVEKDKVERKVAVYAKKLNEMEIRLKAEQEQNESLIAEIADLYHIIDTQRKQHQKAKAAATIEVQCELKKLQDKVQSDRFENDALNERIAQLNSTNEESQAQIDAKARELLKMEAKMNSLSAENNELSKKMAELKSEVEAKQEELDIADRRKALAEESANEAMENIEKQMKYYASALSQYRALENERAELKKIMSTYQKASE
ncbi:hypothetical protein ACHAWF_007349, partial [Thalassiosira exigua]